MPRNPAKPDPDWWTLRLPPAPHFGVAWTQNERVEPTGVTQSISPRANEDRYYTCWFDDTAAQAKPVQVYMVLDGHEGTRACEYTMKHLPSVLLHGRLSGGQQAIKDAITTAYLDTEHTFFRMLDPQIVRKVTLQLEIQKAQTSFEALQMFPNQVEEIRRLDEMIKGGTTVALAVLYDNALYISNVGDSRAVYCYVDKRTGILQAYQLSVDHVATNEDEIERLRGVGLDPAILRKSKRLGMQQNTRSIGDYSIKGGYKDVDVIRRATQEPGTAHPYVADGISLRDLPPGFLILMTDGLYTAYQQYLDSQAAKHEPHQRYGNVNLELGYLIANELMRNHDLHNVARNVVDRVKQLFRETCRQNHKGDRIDDITLIIRNFGYPPVSTAPATVGRENVFQFSPSPSQGQPGGPASPPYRTQESSPMYYPTGPKSLQVSHGYQPETPIQSDRVALQDVRMFQTDPRHSQQGHGIPLRGSARGQLFPPSQPMRPSRSADDLHLQPNEAPVHRAAEYVNVVPSGQRRGSDPMNLEQAFQQQLTMSAAQPGGDAPQGHHQQSFASPRGEDTTLTGPPEPRYPSGGDETLKGRPVSQSDEELMYGPRETSQPLPMPRQQVVSQHTVSATPPQPPVSTSPPPDTDEQQDWVDIPRRNSESMSESEDERAQDGLIEAHVRFDKIPPDLSWDEI